MSLSSSSLRNPVGSGVACRALALAVSGLASEALAGYEVPNSQYAAPATYYNTATGTGATLKNQLKTIITTGVRTISYDDARWALQLLDQDPNNGNNILLMYNRVSVAKTWDSGQTWNREHQWPDSRGLGGSGGDYSDLFNLRACDDVINSNRGNAPYGSVSSTGTHGANGIYYFPGDQDKGDAARSLFYMAVRYDGSQASTTNLELVNGDPGTATDSNPKMGDLTSLLRYHYTDGPDNFERRRNHLIYSQAANPSYYQGNRNPFVDRPEFVWAVFGGGNNNSQLSVGPGASVATDGSSSVTVDLGRAIVGAALPTGSAVLNKTGAAPTTFDVTATGVATTAGSAVPVGTGQVVDYNNVTRTLSFQLTGSTATAGVKTGSITINNTDLTSGGTGRGSADGNDTINITATVVDHANPSFSLAADVNGRTIDFGYVPQGFAPRTVAFNIANLHAASGYTAGLALKSVSPGGSAAFTDNVTGFTNIAAGTQNTYAATLSTAAAGTLSATRSYSTSDEAIPGAASAGVLSLTMTARVISAATFPVTGFLRLDAGETYDTGPFAIAAGVTLTKTGPGAMRVTGPQSNGDGAALAVDAGSVTFAPGTSTGTLAGVTVSPGASLDLTDNALVLTGDAPPQAHAGLVRGYLLDNRLTSSSPDPQDILSLGYVPSSPTSLLVRLTYAGDANLDGTVTVDDYTIIDYGFATAGVFWWQGDFDYDGSVTGADYFLMDRAFTLQSGSLAPSLLAEREARFGGAYVSALIAAVPEPSSLATVVAPLIASVGRRRRWTR